MKVFRLSVIIFALTIFCAKLFAIKEIPTLQESDERSWKLLEKAEVSYDKGMYEDAYMLLGKAKVNRKNEVSWALYTLDEATKPVSVQRAGDDLAETIEILHKRSINAIKLINTIFQVYGKEKFHNSVSNLKNFIKSYYAYPEADFLEGKIFYLEGEYDLAAASYRKAWESWQVLDIENTKFDILYEMANLAKIQNDEKTYEDTLILIIKSDVQELNMNLINRSFKIVNSSDRFFAMYRDSNYFSIKASFMLADFYLGKNQIDKALENSLLGVISTISRIEEVLKERDFNFKFKNLPELIQNATNHSDIISWTDSQDVWKGLYEFAELAKLKGKSSFNEDILKALYLNCPDEYWQKMAYQSLIK